MDAGITAEENTPHLSFSKMWLYPLRRLPHRHTAECYCISPISINIVTASWGISCIILADNKSIIITNREAQGYLKFLAWELLFQKPQSLKTQSGLFFYSEPKKESNMLEKCTKRDESGKFSWMNIDVQPIWKLPYFLHISSNKKQKQYWPCFFHTVLSKTF